MQRFGAGGLPASTPSLEWRPQPAPHPNHQPLLMEPTMKKLSLDLGELCVESFSTDRASTTRGTVHARISAVTGCRTCVSGIEACDPTNMASCWDTACCRPTAEC